MGHSEHLRIACVNELSTTRSNSKTFCSLGCRRLPTPHPKRFFIAMTFNFPEIWNMPPFFTLQPVLNTRNKQIQLWGNLILDYTRHFKLHEFDVQEAVATCPLFNNTAINRRLTVDTLRVFLDDLVKRGNAKWLDKDKRTIRIIWRTDEEWANIIYKYVLDQRMTDTVCTIYELRESDKVEGQEFYQLDLSIFMNALAILEKRGVAKVFSGASKDLVGVKFFAKAP